MKYEVTIKGLLSTNLEAGLGDYYYDLACDCIEAIIKVDTKYSYQSVEVTYHGGGEFILTLRKRITVSETPTVGEMQGELKDMFGDELFSAISSIPFAWSDFLQNMRITEVTRLSED